ncbi:RagB/SusD family nutrient uptake outer membrane protein [Sphingobacterium faecium]|uniref:RagB/SusD family nutrient uptake outer membrane protein n=1 Tax=Sphingobacterium faecium TaxID=34087 RepID=UPI0012929CE0|nr:RagB/SusD family nutrient uptake outer membrane protein [Sphingobacterium faecium]MQP26771.1 RagB/SusD family nutrient uptake outer membrane protein [Sphingobacterium faecium]
MLQFKYFKVIRISVLCIVALMFSSCDKFLEEKSDKAFVVPNSLQDLQALLDNNSVINLNMSAGLIEMNTDDFFVESVVYNGLTEFEKQAYRYDSHPWFQQINVNQQWKNPFLTIYYTNTVLDRLSLLKNDNTKEYQAIKGAALFIRAFTFFQLAQVYCPDYRKGDVNHNNAALGLPLRLNPDFSEQSRRSTVLETYSQIIKDLKEAELLLPDQIEYVMRPSKLAAIAMLARVYLNMEDYSEALVYAEKALSINNTLMDYKLRNTNINTPFEIMNPEVIFQAHCTSLSILNGSRANVDTLLYQQYSDDDLRKKLFFNSKTNGRVAFKGNYAGQYSSSFFNGLAIDELYLIKAECLARDNKLTAAKLIMTQLLKNRFATTYHFPNQYQSQEEVLRYILLERRKQLLFRGIRWSDIRRLNKDVRFRKELERNITIDGQNKTFNLPFDDVRMTVLIPQDVITKTGMQQNPR